MINKIIPRLHELHFCVPFDFFREEFDAKYQDRLVEYEEELKEWKREAKRRVW